MSLLSAARAGEIDKIKELIAEGADVNQANAEGWTPINYAAYYVSVARLWFRALQQQSVFVG